MGLGLGYPEKNVHYTICIITAQSHTEIMLLDALKAADMQTIICLCEICVILHEQGEKKQVDRHNEPDLSNTVSILPIG